MRSLTSPGNTALTLVGGVYGRCHGRDGGLFAGHADRDGRGGGLLSLPPISPGGGSGAVSGGAQKEKPTSSGCRCRASSASRRPRQRARRARREDYKSPGSSPDRTADRVVQECDTWRRIRYSDGTMGGCSRKSLGQAHRGESPEERPTADLYQFVGGFRSRCAGRQREVTSARRLVPHHRQRLQGWIPQNQLWASTQREIDWT